MKEKQIEEIYNLLFCDKWEQPFTECPEDIKCMDCIAKKLYEQGYRKIDKNSVVLSTEHIKKIKQIIDNICEAELGQVHASSKDGKVTKTVDTSLIAKNIYEHLTENIVINTPTIQCETYSNGDMVVISKDDYEAMQIKIEQLTKYAENERQLREHYCNEASKETAEKYHTLMNDCIKSNLNIRKNKNTFAMALSRDNDELAKQFGVEIKE